jgi:hypothetical protein
MINTKYEYSNSIILSIFFNYRIDWKYIKVATSSFYWFYKERVVDLEYLDLHYLLD